MDEALHSSVRDDSRGSVVLGRLPFGDLIQGAMLPDWERTAPGYAGPAVSLPPSWSFYLRSEVEFCEFKALREDERKSWVASKRAILAEPGEEVVALDKIGPGGGCSPLVHGWVQHPSLGKVYLHHSLNQF